MQARIDRIIFFLLVLGISLLAEISFAAATKPPLPIDQAFIFSATFNRPNELLAEFRIAPGYYLYTKRIQFSFAPNNIATDIRLPQGILKYDGSGKRNDVYSGLISVPITLKATNQKINLNVDYQGCSQEGFCYPPAHKTLWLNVVDQTITLDGSVYTAPPKNVSSFQALLTNQTGVKNLLQTQHFTMLLLIFAGLGLLLAFTPCVLPMIPILTSIIVGQKHTISTQKAFLLSFTYILGSAITYAFAGLIAASMGNSLQVWLQKPLIIAAVSGFFVVLALSLFGLFDLRFPRTWQNYITGWSNKQQGGTYVGVFCMGALSTLIVSPCVTAPLVGVLMYIGETGDRILGASALFAMGLGMGIPLLAIGMSAGKWLPKSGTWMEAIKKLFGIMMLAMAIWLFSRIASPMLITICWIVLLAVIVLFFTLYLPRLVGRHKFHRGLGLLVGCFGMVLIVSGADISTTMGKWIEPKHVTIPTVAFTTVHSVADLNKKLSQAQAAGRPVILDFYADWCESCVTMEHKVFNAPDVQRVLQQYVLLRADLSANDADDEALLKQYQVIAPPTVLFFNTKGKELNSQRIVGEVDAKEFLARVDSADATCNKNVKC